MVMMTVGVALTAALAGCGDAAPGDTLSPSALQGRDVAAAQGCAACHGDGGEGGVGPAWIRLAGSTVELADGGEVLADTPYLRRSILEPDAEIVAGYTVAMPEPSLTPEEVEVIVAYIEELE